MNDISGLVKQVWLHLLCNGTRNLFDVRNAGPVRESLVWLELVGTVSVSRRRDLMECVLKCELKECVQ